MKPRTSSSPGTGSGSESVEIDRQLLFCSKVHGFELGYELELGHGSKYTTLASNMFKTVLGVFSTVPSVKVLSYNVYLQKSRSAFKCIHFPALSMDPSNLLVKIHKI